MSRYHSYLNTAVLLTGTYQGDQPFAVYLKKYFAEHKKYGSKDRKWISHLCYCFFRLGKTAGALTPEERILASLFLCSNEHNELLDQLRPGWNGRVGADFEEKAGVINLFHQKEVIRLADIFVQQELSEGIDRGGFSLSHLAQPDLFIRVRPGRENIVKEKLAGAGVSFRPMNNSCLAMDNATKLDNVIEADKDAVIQDYSSQRIAEFFPPAENPLSVWDCCAASGGKSILAFDFLNVRELMVTDIRASVLANLRKRFHKGGLANYELRQMDLAREGLGEEKFDLIIADVPCTGSGTWSRTPEQLYLFNENAIPAFTDLQKKICSKVVRSLKRGGYLLYATCSVFRMENEANLSFLENELNLKIVRSGILTGYDHKADTLFGALLQKPTA